MKLLTKLKSAPMALALLAYGAAAQADSFSNVSANGITAGQMSKNAANSLVDGVSFFEAALYIGGVICICLFILTLIKWRKSDGREGSPGMIATYLVAAVFCIGAPTLMGGGLSTIFGGSNVTTVKAPSSTATFTGN